ncbi:hypothetical protein [Chitinilyticum aquatile]|uniref:hypothetical protein n=1 Tax=Chitinilyticum aquatile TaxID=362520 RepID=UPI00048A5CEA|nr:hypothetical protein [Chitinilyticum aquatile]
MRVAVVAGDPGGGNVLLPVLQELRDAGFSLRLFAYGSTLARWAAEGWVVVSAETPDLSDCDVLLTATSVNAMMHELHWWQAAKAAGIPSFAVVDFWSNYLARFTTADGKPVFPDRIGLPDGAALAAAADAGLPAERLCVAGVPVLEQLGRRPPLTATRKAEIRRINHVAAGKELWIFVSQPLREMAALTGRGGLDELQILQDIQRALAELQLPVALRLRQHPREPACEFTSDWADFALLKADDIYDCLCAADKVLGISSMLLLEAAALGCPVLSYQPGMTACTDGLPWQEQGAIVRAYGFPELLVRLRQRNTHGCMIMKPNEINASSRIRYELEKMKGL